MARKKGEKTEAVKTIDTPAGWESVGSGGIIKWEKGYIIEGNILDVRAAGKGRIIDFRDKDQGIITVGCPTFLFNMVNKLDRKDYVRITCLGKAPSKNGPAWQFDVIRKK